MWLFFVVLALCGVFGTQHVCVDAAMIRKLPLMSLNLCAVALFTLACSGYLSRSGADLAPLRRILVAAAAPLGFLLMELSWNSGALDMEPYYIVSNVVLLAVLFAVVFLAAQRSRAGIVLFWTVCAIWGVANHYLMEFKGQIISPADFLAARTAMQVSGNYTFAIDAQVFAGVSLLLTMCSLLALAPAARLAVRSTAVNTVAAVLIAAMMAYNLGQLDYGEYFRVTIHSWSPHGTYEEKGTTLCFMKQIQDLQPDTPTQYSAEAALQIMQGKAAGQDASEAQDASSWELLPGVAYADDEAAMPADEQIYPTVIAIMDESFSDLSQYPLLADAPVRPENYYRIAAESLSSGYTYVSVTGAGTSQSEFEFLTGASTGLMDSVVPYMTYDLSNCDTLVSYFNDLGYEAVAMHPELCSNWNRDVVYSAFGFSSFHDKAEFEDAKTLRGYVMDEEDYTWIADRVASADNRQFIFNVTMQNHGGYETGMVPDELAADFKLANGEPHLECNEYAAVLADSDRALGEFIDQLNQMDKPIVVCLFGDHQPAFSRTIWAKSHQGEDLGGGELGIAENEEKYVTPYFIWANEAMRTQMEQAYGTIEEHHGERMSLNYLGAHLLADAKMPLSSHWQYLLDAQKELPIVNACGYLDAAGEWAEIDLPQVYKGTDYAPQSLRDMLVVQHGMLFDASSLKA